MNEKTSRLEESQADIIVWLKETAENSADFVTEQAPLVCQEIVTFGRVWHTMDLIFCLFMLALGCFGVRMVVKHGPEGFVETFNHHSAKAVAGLAMAFLGLLVGTLGGVAALKSATIAWFAPRLYIIDYLKDLF